MSMLKTLAKVAIGVAVVKGVSGMMQKPDADRDAEPHHPGSASGFGGPNSPAAKAPPARTPPPPPAPPKPATDTVLGSFGAAPVTQPKPRAAGISRQQGAGLEDILGQLFGNSTPAPRQPAPKEASSGASPSAGLEDLLGQILGGGATPGQNTNTGQPAPQQGGGLGDLLGQVLGGGLGAAPGSTTKGAAQTARRGGLGGALDELSELSRPSGGSGRAGKAPAAKPKSGGSFGDLLNDSFGGAPSRTPTHDEEDLARHLLRAILQTAKVDGKIDSAEKKKILGSIGQPTRDEMEFLNAEMARPVDIRGLVADTPRGAEAQTYMMSLMGIDLDTRAEAEYLHELATGLGLDPQTVNAIHARLGVPALYR